MTRRHLITPTRRGLITGVALAAFQRPAHAFSLLPFRSGAPALNQSYNLFNVKESPFNAVGNTVYTTGSIGASSNILTGTGAPAFSIADVGKVISVIGAGASGAPLVTTIAGFTDSTHVTTTVSATTAVTANPVTYGTDDTTAIQAAITACYNAGGGVVWFPLGKYMINGPFQATSAQNGQLIFPTNAGALVEIVLAGEQVAGFPATNTVSLYSPRNGSGTGPALLSGGDNSVLPTTLNDVFAQLVNLEFKTAWQNPNPLICANLAASCCAHVEGCQFISDAPYGTYPDGPVLAPVSGSVGLRTPSLNNYSYNNVLYCSAQYQDVGFDWREHGNLDYCAASWCGSGFRLQTSYHILSGHSISANWCAVGILANPTVVGGATRIPVYINNYDAEHILDTGKWNSNMVDVSDASNVIYGKMASYVVIQSSSGYDQAGFNKTGGTNFTCTTLY